MKKPLPDRSIEAEVSRWGRGQLEGRYLVLRKELLSMKIAAFTWMFVGILGIGYFVWDVWPKG